MIQAEVTGDEVVAYRLRRVPEQVKGRVRDTIGRLALKLQRQVMQDKLSGQVLKVRTGTLRRSINQAMLEEGDTIAGIVSTRVKYGKAHEYGFKGPVTVKAHLRTIKQAFGKPLKAPVTVTVKAHTANINLPERSFLRSALKDMAPDVQRSLQAAISKGIA